MVSFKLRGLIPPVFTPFNDDFSLNLNLIPSYVKYLKGKKIEGILVNGTTGEGVSMTTEERMKVTEEWLKWAKKESMHVMVQVGGGSLPQVLQLARHAEKFGADSLLTLPELFFKPVTVSDLVDYLDSISQAAPNTPLLYYHFPAMTNVNLSMTSMVEEAQKKVKTFRGVKLTTPNLDEGAGVLRVCTGDTTAFLGCDTLLVAANAMGMDSSIGTTFNMLSQHATFIRDGVMNPDKGLLQEASKKQKELDEIVNLISKHGTWVPTMKAAMKILTGIDVGPVRPPNKYLSQDQIKQMTEELKGFMKRE